VRVRCRQLSDDDDNDNDDDDVVSRSWKTMFVSSEATSTIVDSLDPDRRYLIVVDAKNEVGYNTSLTSEPVVIPDAESSKCVVNTHLLRVHYS